VQFKKSMGRGAWACASGALTPRRRCAARSRAGPRGKEKEASPGPRASRRSATLSCAAQCFLESGHWLAKAGWCDEGGAGRATWSGSTCPAMSVAIGTATCRGRSRPHALRQTSQRRQCAGSAVPWRRRRAPRIRRQRRLSTATATFAWDEGVTWHDCNENHSHLSIISLAPGSDATALLSAGNSPRSADRNLGRNIARRAS